MKKILILLVSVFIFIDVANAAAPSRQFNYVLSTVIDPAQNNANENAIYNYLSAGVDTYSPGSITNAAVSGTAGIAYSKLTLNNSIINSDISSSASIDYSKLNLTGNIVNSDISSSASIATSKINFGISNQGDIFVDNGSGITRLAHGTSGQFLKTQGSGANVVWGDVTIPPVTSNLLFSFGLPCDVIGFVSGSSITGSITPTFAYWSTQAGSASAWQTVIATKLIKIPGVSTATIWCRIWQTAGNTAQCKVNIGSTSGSVSGTASQTTPEWKSFTIDISGLTNGTTYDVTIQLSNNNSNGQNINLGSIIAFGS